MATMSSAAAAIVYVHGSLRVTPNSSDARTDDTAIAAAMPATTPLFFGGGNDIVDHPMALWIRGYNATLPLAALIRTARVLQRSRRSVSAPAPAPFRTLSRSL